MVYENFRDGNYVTVWDGPGDLNTVFISRPQLIESELLGVLLLSKSLSKSQIVQFAGELHSSGVDPISTRQKLPRELREMMSKHLLMSLDNLALSEQTVTVDSAWRYEQLLDWGESSAVVVLAEYMGVKTGTMRARLAQARMNGLLDSPGRGSRKH